MAYSDVIPSMLNLFSSFTDDKMVPQAISAHDKFIIIILLQYIMFLFWRNYLPNKQKSSDFSPFYLSKDYCIHSFWSQNTEKRNNTISQMRLRSVFKMRTSILNTATTEQMGYGTISFFVCFPLMNQIVDLFFFVYYNSASVMVLN